MAKRELQEINAGSMADIAFLLLIFFLVTTTMDTDSGMLRKLPPPVENPQELEDIKVKDRNVFVVLVNRNDQLMVEGKPMALRNLRAAAKEFIENPNNDENLPAIDYEEIPYFGVQPVTKKHVISLQNDRGTSYKMYIAVQNELAAAYNELRDEKAMLKWGKKFDDLSEDQQSAIEEIYPQKISEAEPKDIGGK